MNEVDTVIHLAGQLGAFGISYESYYNVNCLATINLLRLAEERGVNHFIYCSTPGVNGFGKRLIKENDCYSPRGDYEKTKMLAEQQIREFCTNSNIKFTILRPDFVFGPGDYRRVKMYRNIHKKRFILTTSGTSFLHPTYIDDVLQGILLCINNNNAYNQIYNLAAETDITSKQYLCAIADAVNAKLIHINLGYRMSIIIASTIDFVVRLFFRRESFISKNKIDFLSLDHSSCIEKAKKEIGYIPRYNFEHGINLTVKWMAANKLL